MLPKHRSAPSLVCRRPPSAPAPKSVIKCGLAIALLLCASRAHADQTDDTPVNHGPVTLDPIVVSASRSPRSAFDMPYATDAISGETMSQRLYRTTPDALRDIPGVMIQKTSHGQGSPFIRGFTGFRNVFLIDGIRLNNSVFREGPNQYWNTVDPLSLDRLEIVKGPGSVLYGSDAVGGTVNAITRSPSTYDTGTRFAGRAYYRASSAENSHTARGEISAAVDQSFAILAGATTKQFGDLIAGDGVGRQPTTGYDEWDADFKAQYQLSPNAMITVAHQRVQQNNVPRTHATADAKSFAGTSPGSDRKRDLDQDRQLTYVQLEAHDTGTFADTLKISLSHQRQSETQDRVRGNGARELQGFDVDTIGFSLQLESRSPIGNLVYGLEYYHDDVDSFSSTNAIQGPVADEAAYDLLGLFVQGTIPVSDRVELILGGRFDYARADAERVRDPNTGNPISLTDDWSALVGSARLAWRPDHARHWNLYTGVSQGFRAPNLSDLTRFDIARSSEIETAAPRLDPEYFVSFEVGAKARYDDFTLGASYFYTDIRDMIVRVPTGNIIAVNTEVTKRNAGDGFIHGIELGASARVATQWTLFGTMTWMEGEVDTFATSAPVISREPIDRLIPLAGQVGLRWDAPSKRLWLEGVVTLTQTQDKLSTRDAADTQRIPPTGTPGYAVLTLRSGWRINEKTILTLALENVTDEDYRVHGSGQNEPGRNFVLSMDITY